MSIRDVFKGVSNDGDENSDKDILTISIGSISRLVT